MAVRDLPIAVNVSPVSPKHCANTDATVWIIKNPLSQNPKAYPLKFENPLLNDSVGKNLMIWLDDGKSAVVSRIIEGNSGSNGPDCAKIEPLVVDLRSGKLSRPTLEIQQAQSDSSFYNENLLPIADETNRKIVGYVFTAHPHLYEHKDSPNENRVRPDGSQLTPIDNPRLKTGSHGCYISPNSELLACEPRREPGSSLERDGIQLFPIDKPSEKTNIKRPDEEIALGWVAWRPDSSGLVYYSHSTDKRHGWLVYCQIDRSKLHSNAADRQKALEYHILDTTVTPSYFCRPKDTSNELGDSAPVCLDYGGGHIGSDLPVWSPKSRTGSPYYYVYYSGLIKGKDNQTPQGYRQSHS